MFDRNELILESLTEIPDAPAQTMERPSHNPRELPRSVKSHVPLPGAVTQSRRLHSPFPFRNFVFKQEAPGSADWRKINNINGGLSERYIVGFDIKVRIALRLSRRPSRGLRTLSGRTIIVL